MFLPSLAIFCRTVRTGRVGLGPVPLGRTRWGGWYFGVDVGDEEFGGGCYFFGFSPGVAALVGAGASVSGVGVSVVGSAPSAFAAFGAAGVAGPAGTAAGLVARTGFLALFGVGLLGFGAA